MALLPLLLLPSSLAKFKPLYFPDYCNRFARTSSNFSSFKSEHKFVSDSTHLFCMNLHVVRPNVLPFVVACLFKARPALRKRNWSNLRTPIFSTQYTLLGPHRSEYSKRSCVTRRPGRAHRSFPPDSETSTVIATSLSFHVESCACVSSNCCFQKPSLFLILMKSLASLSTSSLAFVP